MSRRSTHMSWLSAAGLVGLLAVVPGASTGSAQSMNDMVRTLNNVMNPGDAQRLEDQARRNGRSQEERYWRDYRAGLESPAGTVAIIVTEIAATIAAGTTTASATTVTAAIAATGVTIATSAIIATISAENP